MIQISQGNVVTQTVLDGLISYGVCVPKYYESRFSVDKVIAIIGLGLEEFRITFRATRYIFIVRSIPVSVDLSRFRHSFSLLIFHNFYRAMH